MDFKNKTMRIRILLFSFGVVFISLAGAMFILSQKGSDAITIFNQGVSQYFDLSIGIVITLFNLIMLTIFFLVDRKKIGVGTVIIVFGVGPLTSFFINLPLPPMNDITLYLLACIASFVGGIGIAGYMYADLGLAALEGINLSIHRRFHIPIKYIKMTMDAFFTLTGVLLGGIVGFGTIFSLITMGPIVDYVYHFLLKKLPYKKETGIS